MKLELISFSWELFKSDNVESLSTITKSWEITVLNNHSPLITSVVPWVLIVNHITDNWENKVEEFAIWRWILEVWNNNCKVLVDMLVSSEDIDMDKAEKAKQDAINMMEKYKNSKDKIDMDAFIKAEDMLLKSIAQLKIWKNKK